MKQQVSKPNSSSFGLYLNWYLYLSLWRYLKKQILKDLLTSNSKNLGPFRIINEKNWGGGVKLSHICFKNWMFTWRTAKAYFIPSRPPCLTSHCSCVSNLSSTSTVLWTPVSFMCFNTTPNVWAQVSRTGATTCKWERKKIHISKGLSCWIWNLIGQSLS